MEIHLRRRVCTLDQGWNHLHHRAASEGGPGAKAEDSWRKKEQ